MEKLLGKMENSTFSSVISTTNTTHTSEAIAAVTMRVHQTAVVFQLSPGAEIFFTYVENGFSQGRNLLDFSMVANLSVTNRAVRERCQKIWARLANPHIFFMPAAGTSLSPIPRLPLERLLPQNKDARWMMTYAAVDAGSMELLRSLLSAGVSPNFMIPISAKAEEPVLTRVIRYNFKHGKNVEIMRELIKAGAAIEGRDSQGWTPFMHAVLRPDTMNQALMYILKEAGADVNAIIEHPLIYSRADGKTALMLLAEKKEAYYSYQIQALLQLKGIEIEKSIQRERGVVGQTALTIAARGNCIDNLRVLVGARANIDTCDSLGRTPLMVAADGGCFDTLIELVKCGANIEACDTTTGSTALLYAANGNNLKVLCALIDCRADIQACDFRGTTALMIAAERGNAGMLQELLKSLKTRYTQSGFGSSSSSSSSSSSRGSASFNSVSSSVLPLARNVSSSLAHREIRSFLEARGSNGMTALMLATQTMYDKLVRGDSNTCGYVTVIRDLICAGANVNVQDARGHQVVRDLIAKTDLAEIFEKEGLLLKK